MNLNVYDTLSKRHVSLTLSLEHRLPRENDVLAFEAEDPRFKAAHADQLTLNDFKVVCHKGIIVGARTQLRAPRGIYLNVEQMRERVFSQFAAVTVLPERLQPHPLIYVIPDGVPGAGGVVVRDIARLRADGEDPRPGLSFVEKEALSRKQARQVMTRLGFVFTDQG